jgi:hypothetical protein
MAEAIGTVVQDTEYLGSRIKGVASKYVCEFGTGGARRSNKLPITFTPS